MNWRNKIRIFRFLSSVPRGEALYAFAQKKITKSVVLTPGRLRGKVEVALRYWDWLERHADVASIGTHLDFGAGWHPTVPCTLYSLGADTQHLLDVPSLLDDRAVNDTVTLLRAHFEQNKDQRIRRLPETTGSEDWRGLLARHGISYHAPYNAETVEELSGSVDLATSTQALLHIDRESLVECFRQVHTMLKPGGLFLADVHLYDLWRDTDPSLSKYNHLRYDKDDWEKNINTRLMSFNRFKSPDYRQLLEERGFEIAAFDVKGPTEGDLRELGSIPVSEDFSHLSREELGETFLFFAARKKD